MESVITNAQRFKKEKFEKRTEGNVKELIEKYREHISQAEKEGDEEKVLQLEGELRILEKGEKPVFNESEETFGKILSPTEAKNLFEKFGKEGNFYGVENLIEDWGYTQEQLEQWGIPEVKMPEGLSLERAIELGATLTLKPTNAPDGEPLTILKQNEIMAEKYRQAGGGTLLSEPDKKWRMNSDFHTKDNPNKNNEVLAWHLDFPPIPDSNSKNYLEQVEIQIAFLQELFAYQIPTEYQIVIDDFNENKPSMDDVKSDNEATWKEAARILSELKLTQLVRPKPTAVLIDIINNRLKTRVDHEFYQNNYVWTGSRSASGDLVLFGVSDSGGADSSQWGPGLSSAFLWSPFSLQLKI